MKAKAWPREALMLVVPLRVIMTPTPLSSKLTQDVFLEADDAGRIHLAESDNAGSHFFRSLAELNRTKFIEQNACDRVALCTVYSIWNKGEGKIYRRDTETDEWVLVSKIGEAQQLVLRALETLLGVRVRDDSNAAAISTAHGAEDSPSVTSIEVTQPDEKTSSERRHSANTLEAASSLLMVQEAAAAGELEEEDEPRQQHVPEEKTELQVKFENTNISLVASFDSNSSSSLPSSPESDPAKAARAARKMPEQRRRSACPSTDFVADQPGIEFADVASVDVLCGGSGEGVLAIRHEGNKRFLKVLESQIEDFRKADDKGKLRMAQQAVEDADPRGRFLAYNPETGLWHELKRDKAWFKSLRTFLKRHHRLDPDQSDKKQRTLPRPLERYY